MSWSPSASCSRPDAWWTDREPGLGHALETARELLIVGRAHPWATSALALACGLVCSLVLVLLRPVHQPRFVLRVLEPAGDPTTLPRARRQMAEYVREGVMTTDALLGVMERHDLLPRLRRSNAPVAVESFREDIEVEAYQNYFLEERSASEAPRSARLSVSYKSKDPELALAVTRDLGKLVVEREKKARKALADAALADAQATLARATRTLITRYGEIAAKQHLVQHGGTAIDEVELVSLMGSLDWREREVERAEARKAALELGQKLESGSLGLKFEVVDEGAVRRAAQVSWVELALGGLLAFVVSLPACAVLVGAFTSKRGAR